MRTRRAGLIYLALVVVGLSGALGLAYSHRLGVATTVVTLLPTLAGSYLAWATFRSDRSEAAADRELGQIADRLAGAVRRQWEAEAEVRRLNDPYPLPVSWAAASADLVEEWERLESTAAGWPGGGPAERAGWAAGPGELAGADGEIAAVVLQRVPTGRLVVLGAPGSGKTMLLVRLLLALVERRAAGGAVPVLFSLSSWNPAEQRLDEWMAEQLVQDYAGLSESAPGSLDRMTCAQALLAHRLVFPVLDGFDEIPAAVRTAALDRINAALPLGQGVVLSSRAQEYREALSPASAIPARLAGAAGVELQPLRPEAVAAYLRRDSGGTGTAAAARWDPVLARLGARTAPVARTLRTPLMLFLARTIYNPRPGEHSGSLPDPAELCDTARFPTRTELERHLFDAFIPAAYRPHPDPVRHSRWQAAQAQRWLAFLGNHLEHRLRGTTDLAWWQLRYAVRVPLVGLVFGLASAVAGGLVAGLGAGIGIGFGTGLGTGILLGFGVGLPVRRLSGAGHGPLSGLAGGLAGGLVGGVAAGLASLIGIGLAVGPGGGIAAGLGVGLAVGPASGPRGGLAGGFAGGAVAGMMSGLGPGVPSGIVNGIGIGLAAGLTAVLAGRSDPAQRLHWSPVGLTTGLAVGLALGLAAAVVAGPAAGLTVGLVAGAVTTLIAGLAGAPTNLTTAGDPRAVLARDFRTFGVIALAAALAIGMMTDLVTGLAVTTENQLATNPAVLITAGLAPGFWMGLVAGLALGFAQAAWGSFAIVRCWLALRGRLPWRLMSFLADAHVQRGVLRQVGAVYQFRHAELQRRLAAGSDEAY
ncbi:hypothetical protein SSP35_21_00890 [Streptomyces sp. NBRC 110611]|uniref:NACHT domain-containing protein n=1 Tax=Streptomyces sp. NBRC 110611 TaxID=1621259 RepID=UPI0008584C7D|nr:NACHT domain-containing protein [Streptomyces sp. NBRC 110611]GAU70694.1 hypothetical protein SSP35_21_00890 [Streptomyces sp. NBRC 110611]